MFCHPFFLFNDCHAPLRGPQELNAGPGVGGFLKLLKKITTQTKNWSNGHQLCSHLLFSFSNVLDTVYRHISDSYDWSKVKDL